MDKSIPAPAARLLGFIYETEVSRTPPACYEVIYGHNQKKLPKPLTSMTIGEVIDAQKGWSKNYGSSAAGAAQFMRATLQGLAKELGLNGYQKFNGDLQDRLAFHLLKRRGYDLFMAGSITRAEFGKRLAQEWASFPVLGPTAGAHRNLARGQSYYAGDGLNKALVAPEKVEAVLDSLKVLEAIPEPPVADPGPIPIDYPVEPPKETTIMGNFSKLFGSVIGAAFGVAVSKLGLPAELATPEIQGLVTVALTGLVTFIFPANKPN